MLHSHNTSWCYYNCYQAGALEALTSHLKQNYVPQSHGCKEILEGRNQTELMQPYLQEMKDNQKNNFQLVGPLHLYTVQTLEPEDSKLNVSIVNCFTAEHFRRKLPYTENTLKDRDVFVFHL